MIYRDDAAPAAHIPVITRLEDVDKLEIPDPYTAFPMCEIIKATKILSREIGDQVWICGRADQGPMDLASQLFGMEPLMLEIATGEKADLVHRLLDYAREVATRYAFALIESGAHSTSIGEPVAGPDVMSPRHYRKYAQPQEKRMVDDLKAKGIILHNHICGNTIPIINDFIATGAQVLEIDHKTDMRKAKDAGRGKTCFLGHDQHVAAGHGHAAGGRGRLPGGHRDHGARQRLHPGARVRAGHRDAGREHPCAGGSGQEVRKILIQRGGYPCRGQLNP